MIKIMLFTAFFSAIAFGFSVGPEKFVQSDLNGAQKDAQVAHIQNGFLAVWTELSATASPKIMAARIDTSGNVLDSTGITVSAGVSPRVRPSIAYGNGVALVVWSDLRNGHDYDVYGARVTTEGVVLDTTGLLIAGGVDNQSTPGIVALPDGFMVAYEQWVGQGYVPYIVRVGTDGIPLGGAISLVTATATGPFDPSASYAGWGSLINTERPRLALLDTTVLVFWTGGLKRNLWGSYEPHCALVSIHGSILTAARQAYYSGQRDYLPEVITFGNGFYVTWENQNNRGGGAPHNGLFLDANGQNTADTVVYKIHTNLEPALAGFAGACYALHLQTFTSYGTPKQLVHQLVLRRIEKGIRAPVDSFLVATGCVSPALATDGGSRLLMLYSRLPNAANQNLRLIARLVRDTGGTSLETTPQLQAGFGLNVYPNPMSASSMIRILLPANQDKAELKIFNANGSLIRDFSLSGKAGFHSLLWNGLDLNQRTLPAGIYLLKLKAGKRQIVRSIAVIR